MAQYSPSGKEIEDDDWWRRAVACRESGNPAAALVALERYRALHPHVQGVERYYASLLIQLGLLDDAERILNRIEPGREEGEILSDYLAQINIAIARGQLDDEERLSHKLIEALPDRSHGYIRLGICYIRRGKIEAAEQAFRQGTERQGCPDEAYYNLGVALVSQRRFAEAKSCFEQALAIDPHYEAAANKLHDVDKAFQWQALIKTYEQL